MTRTPKTLLRRPTLLVVALLVVSMVLAACGGDDATDDAPETTVAGTETTDIATDGDDEFDAFDDVEDFDGFEDALDDEMSGVSDLSAECQAIYTSWMQSMSGVSGIESGDLSQLGNAMNELRNHIPGEYSDDLDVVASAFTRYGEIMTDAGGDMMSIMDDPEAMAALEDIGSPEVESALDRIGTYFEEGC